MNGDVGGRVHPQELGLGRGHALRFSSPLFPEAQGQGSGGIWTGAFCPRGGQDLPVRQGEEGSG